MSDKAPSARDGFELPGTERVRTDELRVQDRVFVRHNDEDLWATITAVKLSEHAGQLRLRLRLERDGAPIGTVTHTPTAETTYLRLVPYDRPADAIPPTSEQGLAAASLIFRQDWDRHGTVSVHLPMRVARQVLGDRGWEQVSNPDGTFHSWRAPNGDTFWQTSEALQIALTAECADSPSAMVPDGRK